MLQLSLQCRIFFECDLAISLWKWPFLLRESHVQAILFWVHLDCAFHTYRCCERKSAGTAFFHLILILWTFPSYSKFNDIRPSLSRARSLFKECISDLLGTLPYRTNIQQLHPHVLSLDGFGHWSSWLLKSSMFLLLSFGFRLRLCCVFLFFVFW